MHFLRWFLVLFTSYAIALPMASGSETSVVNLNCKGQIEYTTDSRVEQKPLNVDLALDVSGSRARFSDMWGCVIDMGSPNASALTCAATLPVSVTDNEVSFSKEQTNDRYATTTSFTLSRYSGRLVVRSTAVALPASQAKWSLFMLNADLACSPQSKKF